MNTFVAEIFLPRHSSSLLSPMAGPILNEDLIPRSMLNSWNNFGCQTTPSFGADLFAPKGSDDLTFPLGGVDENTVDAILLSINNPRHDVVPAMDVHVAEEPEEDRTWDDALSDMYILLVG